MIVYISKGLIETLPRTVSKQQSLEKICDDLKIKSNEVLAIGDNLNDLDHYDTIIIINLVNIL